MPGSRNGDGVRGGRYNEGLETDMWIVIAGDFLEGIKEARGPFDTEEQATAYSETYNMGHYPKIVVEVERPKEKGSTPPRAA